MLPAQWVVVGGCLAFALTHFPCVELRRVSCWEANAEAQNTANRMHGFGFVSGVDGRKTRTFFRGYVLGATKVFPTALRKVFWGNVEWGSWQAFSGIRSAAPDSRAGAMTAAGQS